MTHHDDHHHSHDHPNGHDHSHNHSHSHGHDHDHGHSHAKAHDHSHSHTHELSFEQKLEKLFSPWINHNNSHKETFLTWAQRAREADLTAVAEDIEKAAQASGEVTRLLQEAREKIVNG